MIHVKWGKNLRYSRYGLKAKFIIPLFSNNTGTEHKTKHQMSKWMWAWSRE